MKRTLALILALMLTVCALSGCGSESAGTPSAVTTGSTEPDASFRELPEGKYITPADGFAGGSGTEADPYQISNAAELALLHEKITADSENLKDDYTSAYYVLTQDIVLNDTAAFDTWENAAPEYSWMPIGFDVAAFDGVFDGKGHTVSGLYINANAGTAEQVGTDNYGLFDTVNGTVKNVNIQKAYIAVSGNSFGVGVGSIAGLLMDTAVIDNCSADAVINCYETTCGGIAGKAYGGVDSGIVKDGEEREIRYSLISNCTFDGVINQVKEGAATYIGGIIGECDGNIDACVNNGTVNFADSNVDSVGGIAGRMSEGTISNCSNTGSLNCQLSGEEALAIAGGIVGKVFVSATGSEKYMSRGAAVTDCENSGAVSAHLYAGGIAGQVSNDHNDYCVTVSGCVNTGTVTARDYTGGVIGYLNCIGDNAAGDSIVVENCENKADLTTGTTGGIIANFMSQTGDVSVTNCKNSGALTSEGQHCAGIIAYWVMNSKPESSNIRIEGCENTGSITSPLNAGGIVSYMDMPVCLEMGKNLSISISNCKNSGNITTNTVNSYIGGILGNFGMENIPTTVDQCENTGNLAITAAADNMTEEDAKIMTVSRIAGGIIGRVGSGLLLTTDSDEADSKNIQSENAVLKITGCNNTGALEVVNENAPFYKNWFGGIVGNTCGEDGFSLLIENCSFTGIEKALGNDGIAGIDPQ